VRQNIPYGAELPVIPGFFSLVHASNTGAAFSMFTGNNFFFVGLAIVALAVIVFLLLRDSRAGKAEPRLSHLTKISFGLLASGILGNLTDRILRGAVTDFLHFTSTNMPGHLLTSQTPVYASLQVFLSSALSEGLRATACEPGGDDSFRRSVSWLAPIPFEVRPRFCTK